MQKIICPKCNNEISSIDTKCINCGLDMTTIEYELKKNELIQEGKIKDTNKKKKAITIIIELVVFLVLMIVYIKLFIPSILEITEEHTIIQKQKKCEKDEGEWDKITKECKYNY